MQSQTTYCEQCGTPRPTDARFCEQCGTPFPLSSLNPETMPPQPRGNASPAGAPWVLVGVLSIIVVVALGSTAWLWIWRERSATVIEQPTVRTEPSLLDTTSAAVVSTPVASPDTAELPATVTRVPSENNNVSTAPTAAVATPHTVDTQTTVNSDEIARLQRAVTAAYTTHVQAVITNAPDEALVHTTLRQAIAALGHAYYRSYLAAGHGTLAQAQQEMQTFLQSLVAQGLGMSSDEIAWGVTTIAATEVPVEPVAQTTPFSAPMTNLPGDAAAAELDLSQPETYLPDPGWQYRFAVAGPDGSDGVVDMVVASISEVALVTSLELIADDLEPETFMAISNHFVAQPDGMYQVGDTNPDIAYPWLMRDLTMNATRDLSGVIFTVQQVDVPCAVGEIRFEHCLVVERHFVEADFVDVATYVPGYGEVLVRDPYNGQVWKQLLECMPMDAQAIEDLVRRHAQNVRYIHPTTSP